jgi:hypothetical protein
MGGSGSTQGDSGKKSCPSGKSCQKKKVVSQPHREREQKEEQGIISEKCFNKFHCNKFLRLNK